jgi:hypothetical protein
MELSRAVTRRLDSSNLAVRTVMYLSLSATIDLKLDLRAARALHCCFDKSAIISSFSLFTFAIATVVSCFEKINIASSREKKKKQEENKRKRWKRKKTTYVFISNQCHICFLKLVILISHLLSFCFKLLCHECHLMHVNFERRR